MKNSLVFALLVMPVLASAQTDEQNIFNKFFGDFGKTNAEITREKKQIHEEEIDATKASVLDLAKKGIEDGLGAQEACDRAIAQSNLVRSANHYTISRRCYSDASPIHYEKTERERTERRAAADALEKSARQAAIEKRQQSELAEKAAMASAVAEIRAGKRQAKSFEEAIAAYEAAEGLNLASAPKIRPDGRTYYLAGTIERADGKAASFTALANNGAVNMMRNALNGAGQGEHKYFYVRLPKAMEAKYYELAKVGVGFNIVGKYSNNLDYKTISGEQKSMPVFHALYFEFWDLKKFW